MARILLIHVMDDHTADDMCGSALPPGAQWVGNFVFPMRKDMSDHPTCLINGKAAWGRDKGGWMRCAVCGKRNKRVRRFLINALFDFLGANLYSEAPGAFRTPEGYGQ